MNDLEKDLFKIQLNKEMILCSTNEILSKLMLKMNIWKCTGDVESANECINHYSEMDENFLKIKKIIEKKPEHNILYLYHNLILDEDGTVTYKDYQESFEGIIETSENDEDNDNAEEEEYFKFENYNFDEYKKQYKKAKLNTIDRNIKLSESQKQLTNNIYILFLLLALINLSLTFLNIVLKSSKPNSPS